MSNSYEFARMNLQLFGEDENEAIDRMVDINEDYPGDGETFPDGMSAGDIPNALTVCAGQLVRIADALEGIRGLLSDSVDACDHRLCIKGTVETI